MAGASTLELEYLTGKQLPPVSWTRWYEHLRDTKSSEGAEAFSEHLTGNSALSIYPCR